MIDPCRNLTARQRTRLAMRLILVILVLAILAFGLRATAAAGCVGPC